MDMKMRISGRVLLLGLTALVVVLAGCASMQGQVSQQDHSGYLTDYGRLQKADTEDGSLQRWLDGSITNGGYRQVMIDPVVLYQMDNKVLSAEQQQEVDKFTTDFDQQLLASLTKVVKVATKPGPGVLHIKPAVTGISSATEGMKAYEVIPVAAIIAGATAAAGGRDKVLILALEARLEDSQSGTLVGEVLRKGVAEQANSDKPEAEDVKALISSWAEEGGEMLQSLM